MTKSHDVEIGSDRDLRVGGWDIHGSETEDLAFMREVRAVRRTTQGHSKVGRIRHAKQIPAFGGTCA